MDTTTITCYLPDLNLLFPIDIDSPAAFVSPHDLQTSIWAKHSSALLSRSKKPIDASDLVLHKTCFPIDTHLAEGAKTAIAETDPLHRGSAHDFEDAEPGAVHLVAALPTSSYGALLSRMQSFHDRWWGKPLDVALTALPAADEANDNDGGDLLPGDPFLEVDSEITLLVRAEYIRVFDMVMDLSRDKFVRTSLAVVTGSSGIGKTWWIYYALRRCLGEQQPVAWYLERDKYFWFAPSGVSIVTYPSCAQGTWCLVDSADAPVTLDPKTSTYMLPLFPVYVTPPRRSRWRKLHKAGRTPRVVVMNPWTWPEIEKAAQLFPAEHNPIADVRARFRTAGPVVRRCLLSQPEVPEAHGAPPLPTPLDAGAFARLVLDSQILLMDHSSDAVCLVRRSSASKWGYTIEPITPDIRRRVRSELQQWDEGELLYRLRQLFQGSWANNGIAGILFEVRIRRAFGRRIGLVAAPMFRTGRANPHWRAVPSDTAPELPLLLDVTPTECCIYDPPLRAREGVYYVPRDASQVAVDSFILSGGCLYFFLFAGGSEAYDIEPGLEDFLSGLSGPLLPDRSRWRFVFVVPSHREEFECGDGGVWGDYGPYVARVGLGGD